MNGFSRNTVMFVLLFGVAFGLAVPVLSVKIAGKTVVSKTSAQYAYEPDLKPTDEQITDCQASLETLQEWLFRDAAKAGGAASQITFDNLSRNNSIFIEGYVAVGERRPGAFANYCDKSKLDSSIETLAQLANRNYY